MENEKSMNNETSPLSSSLLRAKARGAASRLIVLLLFLVVVGAGCIYEFAVARPTFQAAWEKIQQIDDGTMEIDGERMEPSEITSLQIQEMLGREPFKVDNELHKECRVETYRWPSGMVLKNHDIHIVYTKLNDAIQEKQPKLKDKFFYYSASAGQPLDLEQNFPKEKQTLVVNLNPPQISMGGGPPGGGGQGGQQRRRRRGGGGDPSPKKNDEATDEAKEDGEKKMAETKEEAVEEPKKEMMEEAKEQPAEGSGEKAEEKMTEEKAEKKMEEKMEEKVEEMMEKKKEDPEKSDG